MIIRSRAPLRIGFAGGGTDLPSYSEKFSGAVLNATINLYAYASIKLRNDKKIVLNAVDKSQRIELDAKKQLPIDGNLDLLKGVYNCIVKNYVKEPFGFEITTHVDAPSGSGLGSSSTLTVAIIGAFVELFSLPLGEYDIADLAYNIERVQLKMDGGKQDQYSSTFGGVNFMEFSLNNKVIVNPLRIKTEFLNDLEFNLLLYYTGTSRLSSDIIKTQSENVTKNNKKSLSAMHSMKAQAFMMKEALLRGRINDIGQILNFGWKYKKKSAKGISNTMIEQIYETALQHGASGGKISGAGGGGFMMFYCPGNTKYNVIKELQKYGGEFKNFRFTNEGLTTWRSKDK